MIQGETTQDDCVDGTGISSASTGIPSQVSEGESTCVRVAIRVRPCTPAEVASGGVPCIEAHPEQNQLWFPTLSKAHCFDHVFGPHASQAFVFKESATSLIEAALEGYNATILAYGQTGSGKTYTMGINPGSNGNSEDWGIVPRSIEALFSRMEKRIAEGAKCSMACSFLEIYNEDIRDLLGGGAEVVASGLRPRIVEESGKISVQNVHEVPVSGSKEAFACLEQGGRNRCIGATLLNAQSSRSHGIFTLNMSLNSDGICTSTKFHFVDLGGSERVKRTQTSGSRLQEGIAINQGLLALGNVICALTTPGRTESSFVPYRQSKLTRMLQDSLGGSARTLMICCASSAPADLGETFNTVRYASRARSIQNACVVNVESMRGGDNSALCNRVKELEAEVLTLRTERGHWQARMRTTVLRAISCHTKSVATSNNANKEVEESQLFRALISPKRVTTAATSSRTSSLDGQQQSRRSPLKSADSTRRQRSRSAQVKSPSAQSGGVPSDADISDQEDWQSAQGEDDIASQEMGADEREAMTALIDDPDLEIEDEDRKKLREIVNAGSQQEVLANELEALATEMESKTQLYNNLQTEAGRFTSDVDRVQTNLNGLEERLRQAVRERDALQKQLANAKAAKDKNMLEKQVAEQQRKIDRQQSELQKLQEERARLMSTKQEGHHQMQRLNSEITRLRTDRVRAEKQHQAATERMRQLLARKQGMVAQLTRKAQRQCADLCNKEQKGQQANALLQKRNQELVVKLKCLQQMQERRIDSRMHKIRRVGKPRDRRVAGVPLNIGAEESDAEVCSSRITKWLRQALQAKLAGDDGTDKPQGFERGEVKDLVQTCALNMDCLAETLLAEHLSALRSLDKSKREADVLRREVQKLRASRLAERRGGASTEAESDTGSQRKVRNTAADLKTLDKLQRINRLAAEKRNCSSVDQTPTALRHRSVPVAKDQNSSAPCRTSENTSEKENEKPIVKEAWKDPKSDEQHDDEPKSPRADMATKTPRRCASEKMLMSPSPASRAMDPPPTPPSRIGSPGGRSVFARLQQDVSDRRTRAEQKWERAREEEAKGFAFHDLDEKVPFLRPGTHRQWGDEEFAEVPESYKKEIESATSMEFCCAHRTREAHSYYVSSCCLAWDEILYSGSLSVVKQWKVTPTGPEQINELTFPDSQRLVKCVKIDEAGGSGLLAAAVGSSARLHDPRCLGQDGNGDVCRVNGAGEVSCVAFLPGGLPLLAVAAERSVRLFDLRSLGGLCASTPGGPRRGSKKHEPVERLDAHSEVMALEVTAKRLAVGCRDHHVRHWCRQDGSEDDVSARWGTNGHILTPPHTDTVQALLWHNDDTLLSGSRDRYIRAWSLADSRDLKLMAHQDRITSLAKFKDGRVVSSSRDGTIRVWNCDENGVGLSPTSGIVRHSKVAVNGICASSDFFISVSSDRSMAVWRERNSTKESILDEK